jgi:hypothetical protein
MITGLLIYSKAAMDLAAITVAGVVHRPPAAYTPNPTDHV